MHIATRKLQERPTGVELLTELNGRAIDILC